MGNCTHTHERIIRSKDLISPGHVTAHSSVFLPLCPPLCLRCLSMHQSDNVHLSETLLDDRKSKVTFTPASSVFPIPPESFSSKAHFLQVMMALKEKD